MSKKALVVVSFGTTYKNAIGAIESIENKLIQNFEGFDFYRAFTSRMVIKGCFEKHGETILNPLELFNKLAEEGYEEIICQSTHVINGIEYDKLVCDIAMCSHKFKSFKLGAPMLSDEEDFIECANAVMSELPKLEENEAIVLMGHGTDHFSNGAYCQFENTLRFLDYENIYVGTVEGFPSLEYVFKRLQKKPNIKKIHIAPFMIVAGDHAQNDLAGEGSDSWKSILEEEGYEVNCIVKGIGEFDGISDIFVKHLKHSADLV